MQDKIDIHQYICSNPSEKYQFDMYRHNALLQHLLRGKDIPDLQKEIRLRNAALPSDCFCVVESHIILFDRQYNEIKGSIYDWRKLRHDMSAALDKQLGSRFHAFPIDTEHGLRWILCTPDTSRRSLAHICSAFDSVSENISEFNNLLCSFAVSDIVKGFREVNSAYKQALTLSEYLHCNDIYGAHCCEAAISNGRESNPVDLQGWFNELRVLLFSGKFDRASDTIERFSLEAEANQSIIRTRYRFGMLIEITLETLESIQHLYPGTLTQQRLEDILKCDTVGKYKACMGRLLDGLEQERHDRRTSTGSRADAILDYIQNNLSDANLNVGMIADRFGLTIATISRLTRERTGVTALEYIHNLRVGEAKRLMSETKGSIAEIAKKVGYDNPISFYRIFRKYEGMSPSDYRFYSQTG